MRFMIYLDNKEMYLVEIGRNFHLYKIKKGYLYLGFKKLGKIVKIKEE